MKYNIDYVENDFLQFQLFTASQSKRIKSKGRRSTFMIMIAFLVLALLFKESSTDFFFYAFLVWIPITYFFYPKYIKNHHYKHYQGFVKEMFQKRNNQPTALEFKDETIFSQNEYGESQLKYSAIDRVVEIPEHFFIPLKTGGTLILPKREVSNYEELFSFLREKSQLLEFDYSIYKNWSWK